MLLSVTVTKYIVGVAVGVAVGFANVGLFNVPAGVQLKVDPRGPVGLPPITTEAPSQITVSKPASTIGNELIVMLNVLESTHPFPLVTITL